MNVLLFDLDGTIIDPKIGIIGSLKATLQALDRPIPDNLDWCIGPPIHDTFATLLETKNRTDIEEGVNLYRQYYSNGGLFQCHLYSGISTALSELNDSGYKLFVATSKPTVYAQQIIDHLKLTSLFSKVYGCELDGTRAIKGELIKFILDEESLNGEQCYMIGDRKFDIVGAKQNSLASIGVLWGYGSKDELLAEKPSLLFGSPPDLSDFLKTRIRL